MCCGALFVTEHIFPIETQETQNFKMLHLFMFLTFANIF